MLKLHTRRPLYRKAPALILKAPSQTRSTSTVTMPSTSMVPAVLLWIGLTLYMSAMYGSAACVEPVSGTVTVSKTQYTYTVYWQGRSEAPGDIDAAVLRPPLNATSEVRFGTLLAWDSWMTTLLDANSTRVGHGRGLTIFNSLEKLGEMLYWEAYFDTDFDFGGLGVTNGSALYFTGFHYTADATTEKGYELALVGGTGSFRYCHGYDVEHRVSQDPIKEKLEFHIICNSF